MGIVIDLTGNRYGRLTVIEQSGRSSDRHVMWKCLCDCGKVTLVSSHSLRMGCTKSCGCLNGEMSGKRNYKHGGSNERLYEIWEAMKKRCSNPKCEDYKGYGEKGVTVCDEWMDYGEFRKWAMANGYDPKAKYGDCTIDRINPFGNYEPDNCRWVDLKVQANNKRSNYMENCRGR